MRLTSKGESCQLSMISILYFEMMLFIHTFHSVINSRDGLRVISERYHKIHLKCDFDFNHHRNQIS